MNHLRTSLKITGLICAGLVLSACQSTRSSSPPPPPPAPTSQPVYVPPAWTPAQAPAPAPQVNRVGSEPVRTAPPPVAQAPSSALVGKVFALPDSREISRDQLLQTAAAQRFVVVGVSEENQHHQWVMGWMVEQLAARGVLAGLAMEAIEGNGERITLPRNASSAQIRQFLQWDQRVRGHDFAHYERALVTAANLGIPVIASGLPRNLQTAALSDASLEQSLTPQNRTYMSQVISQRSCNGIDPANMLPIMRVQIANDKAVAQALRANLVQNRTILLLADSQNANRNFGVPSQLAHPNMMTLLFVAVQPDGRVPAQAADMVWVTERGAQRDSCKEYRDNLNKPGRPLLIR
jgi:uncharacterized iron-regulated protein